VSTQEEVLDAAAKVVAAFGSGDVDGYFASFAADARFHWSERGSAEADAHQAVVVVAR
jgi:hypothetical protein